MIYPLITATAILFTAGLLAYVPALTSPAVPLGVRVPKKYQDNTVVTNSLARYRRTVWIVGIVTATAIIAAWQWPIIAALAPGVLLIGCMVAYVRNRKAILTAKEESQWFNDVETTIAAQIRPPRGSQQSTDALIAQLPTPRTPWIWIAGALLVMLAAALTVAYRWAEIPDVIATHWGPKFEADSFSNKSISSVFFSTFIGLGIILMMVLIAFTVTHHSVAGRNDQTIAGRLRTESIMAANNTGCGVLTFLLSISFASIQISTVLPGYQKFIPFTLGLTLLAAFGGTIALIVLTTQYQGKVDDLLRGVTFGDEKKESPNNDQYYKWGMFYYNPNDPAVMVEKRFGVGMDFNYATWQGKTFIVFIVLLVLAPIVLPIVL